MIAENLHQTTLNTDALVQVREVLSSLDQELANLGQKEHSTLVLLEFMLRFQTAFGNVDQHINLLEQYVDKLSIGFSALLSGQLPPELFSPKKALLALQSISEQLPTNWALTIKPQLDSMPRFYQDIKVSWAVSKHHIAYEDKIKLFLHIPIYELKYQFQLYKVYNLPIFNHNSTHGVKFEHMAEYLAISLDKENYIHLDDQDLDHCKKNDITVELSHHTTY